MRNSGPGEVPFTRTVFLEARHDCVVFAEVIRKIASGTKISSWQVVVATERPSHEAKMTETAKTLLRKSILKKAIGLSCK